MQVKNVATIFALEVFGFFFFSFKSMSIFQQCSYRIKEFLPVIFKRKKGEMWRLSIYSLAFCFILPLFALVYRYNIKIFSLLYFIVLVSASALYYFTSKIIKPPCFTSRYLRISFVSAIFYAFFYALIVKVFAGYKDYGIYVYLIAVAMQPILVPLFICFGKICNFPYDKTVYKISVFKCEKIIAKNKDLIKIGITGSFAKTSVKNYLKKMLSTKYRVLETPKSYNTPLGICKTVKGGVLEYDVFIAEMGARYKGDIKELCKIVKPNVGVITGIAEQHTATLGTVKDVKKAKNQLIEGLSSNGFGIFSMQTPYSKQMYYEANVDKYSVGSSEDCFVYYRNFKQLKSGIEFEVVIFEKAYKVFAPLLGEHNAQNICMAVAVSVKLGVEIEKILSVIPTLVAVDHRAKLINSPSGITIIDDGYNANFDGIRSTAKVVSVFDGFKIAVVSGIVEVGKNSQKLNYQVGEVLAEYFNLIIAVGVNSRYIYDGAIKSKVEVVCVEQTQNAKEIISARAKSGDLVAFFNDLPDRY